MVDRPRWGIIWHVIDAADYWLMRARLSIMEAEI
jgi:hypothetical protein